MHPKHKCSGADPGFPEGGSNVEKCVCVWGGVVCLMSYKIS